MSQTRRYLMAAVVLVVFVVLVALIYIALNNSTQPGLSADDKAEIVRLNSNPASSIAIGHTTNTLVDNSPLPNPCTNKPFNTVMDGSGIATASAQTDSIKRQWVVNFSLKANDESLKMGEFTKTHVGQPMAIVLDGLVLSVPVIQAELDSEGEITGNFTQESANSLAAKLSTGTSPLKLSVIGVERYNDNFLVPVRIISGANISPADVQATIQILQKRMSALGFESDVQSVADRLIGVKVVSNSDNDMEPISQALQTGFLEFVDFSPTADCTSAMPGNGQYIQTDGQIAHFGSTQ